MKPGDRVQRRNRGRGRHARKDIGTVMAVSTYGVITVRWDSHGLRSAVAEREIEVVLPAD